MVEVVVERLKEVVVVEVVEVVGWWGGYRYTNGWGTSCMHSSPYNKGNYGS
jgi:hypothetical protein